MAEAEKNQNKQTSFAKNVQLEGYQQNKLDQVKSLSKTYAETQAKGGQEKSSSIQNSHAATSFAKEVKRDAVKQNQLDRVKSLRQVYAQSQGNVVKLNQAQQKSGAIGPKPEPAQHLRLPDSAERRAVDAKIHNDQLAQGRAEARKRAAALARDYQSKSAQQNKTKANSKGR